jgi:hypothetical protein
VRLEAAFLLCVDVPKDAGKLENCQNPWAIEAEMVFSYLVIQAINHCT